MAKKNHVSIRRNVTGSYKMRVSVYHGRKETLQRVQLGLMTDDLMLAVTRAKVVWNAIRLTGYTSVESAVCSYQREEYKLPETEIWDGENIFYKHDLQVATVKPEKSRLIKDTVGKDIVLTSDDAGAFTMSVTFLYYANTLLVSKDIPMVTRNRYEALERGYIVYRTFQHILSGKNGACICVHGNLFEKAVRKTA